VITEVTRRVNGGTHGLDDRLEKTKKIYGWLT
jgi:predicted chitinase